MKTLIPSPQISDVQTKTARQLDAKKQQVGQETKIKVRGAGGGEVGYRTSWHLGQADVQVN